MSPQWTAEDIGVLNNDAENMYVALANNTGAPAVVYYEDPVDPDTIPTQLDGWTTWNIELAEFSDKGINLSDVNSIAIGFGDRNNPVAGGAGKMYFDDIRLYIPRCVASLAQPAADLNNDCVVDYADVEMLTHGWLQADATVATAAPDSNGLFLHYAFDGNADDSSGNNYHGIEVDGPTYVDGKFGQAIHFDGLDDYVAIQDANYAGTGYPEVTVAVWVRTSDPVGQLVSFDRSENWRLEIGGQYAGGNGLVGWDVYTDVGIADTINYPSATARVDDGLWHHLAGVFDNGTMTIYIDGNPQKPYTLGTTFGYGRYTRYGFVGSGSEASYPAPDGRANGAYIEADLDEVYVYHRALSQAEIAYLADDTPEDGEVYAPLASSANLYDEEPQGSKVVNFKDLAVLLQSWLDEELWPTE